jgi:two-component system, cell cycle sensor histidine kinase and response regulator CckA
MLFQNTPPAAPAFPPPGATVPGKPPVSAPTPPRAAVTVPAVPRTAGTILVVDDSAVIRSAVTKTLLEAGHTVHQAENGRLGLEFWTQHKDAIQLVLSDVFMPELDGLSMAKEIRKRSRTVPILLMSSKLDDNSGWVADEAGFRFIPKPFKNEVLLLLVDRLLRIPTKPA